MFFLSFLQLVLEQSLIASKADVCQKNSNDPSIESHKFYGPTKLNMTTHLPNELPVDHCIPTIGLNTELKPCTICHKCTGLNLDENVCYGCDSCVGRQFECAKCNNNYFSGYAYEQGSAAASIGRHPTHAPNPIAPASFIAMARTLESQFGLDSGALGGVSLVFYKGADFCVNCALDDCNGNCNQLLSFHADVLDNNNEKKSPNKKSNKAENGNSQHTDTDIYTISFGGTRKLSLRCQRRFLDEDVSQDKLHEQKERGEDFDLDAMSLFVLSSEDEKFINGQRFLHGMKSPIGKDKVSVAMVFRQIKTIRYMDAETSYIDIDSKKRKRFEDNLQSNGRPKKTRRHMANAYMKERIKWDASLGPKYAQKIKDELVKSLLTWDNGMTKVELNEIAMKCLSKNDN